MFIRIGKSEWDIDIETLKKITLLFELYSELHSELYNDTQQEEVITLDPHIIPEHIFNNIIMLLKKDAVTLCDIELIDMIHKSDMLKCDSVTKVLCEDLAARMEKMSFEQLRSIYLSW
jgi:hypothetical protein